MNKGMFEKPLSPENSNYASSSGLSVDENESGCTASALAKQHPYILVNNSSFHSSPFKLDLNSARVVRTALYSFGINCRKSISTFMCDKLIALDLSCFEMQVMAEMVGTFILMFCVCGIIASTQFQNGEVGLLEYAATAGLTVVVVIFSIGPISCAHVNPAATIAFATFGQFPWLKVLKKQDHSP